MGCLSAGVARELGGLLGSLCASPELVDSSQPAGGTSGSGGMPVPRAAASPLLQAHGGAPSIAPGWVLGSLPTPGTHSSPTAAPGLSADRAMPASTVGARSHRPIPAETLSTRGEDAGLGVPRDHPPPGTDCRRLAPHTHLWQHLHSQVSEPPPKVEPPPPAPAPPHTCCHTYCSGMELMQKTWPRAAAGTTWAGSSAAASPCPLPAVPPAPGVCHPSPFLGCCAGWAGGPAVRGSEWDRHSRLSNLQLLSFGCHSRAAQVQKCSPGR